VVTGDGAIIQMIKGVSVLNERVKEYLERKEQERIFAINKDAIERQQDKRLHLLRLGLCEKVYSEDGVSSEYPEWDHEAGKAYRKVAVDVSDEEYSAICSFERDETVDDQNKNPIAKVLVVIAWVTIIGGFIAGLVLASQEVVVSGVFYNWTETIFNWSTAITYWAASLISGVMFLGFAQIIKLLHSLVNKTS